MKKLVITITENDEGQKTTDIDNKGFNLMEQIVEIQSVIQNRLSVLWKDYYIKDESGKGSQSYSA
jgi:hypothetical protein